MNRSMIELTDAEIRRAAPAIFSEGASPERSARYGFIPTIKVLDPLREAGFAVTYVQQRRVKSEDALPYARHLIRLCRLEDLRALTNVGDVRREIVLTNSHNGGGAYHLFIGLYRLACKNGLIVAQSKLTHLKIWHTPSVRDQVDQVIDGSFRIIEQGEQVMEQVGAMQRIELAPAQQLQLAERAHSLRFPERVEKDGTVYRSPFAPIDLLGVRRQEDAPSDLWTIYNRIQENALAGAMRKQDEAGKWRTSRPLRNIDDTVRLNQALWAAALGMMVESRQVAPQLALV